ncbi:hypothetical protein AUR04nite_28350 [Glutamicibacter uratoxydans]|uniref:Uncharacterized protein n=1 Tax=Glutamicibacter uratoxydans TaxID=43667 RepID=A0A4Y4DRN9_GLUUR|nr:hypothetical protein AUR04nite_28350 [Glutamicibacter uratoxydans]
MQSWFFGGFEHRGSGRIPQHQLAQQVLPFNVPLAAGQLHEFATPPLRRTQDFGRVEVVAALLGFVPDPLQVMADSHQWFGLFFEAHQLRVFGVAPGFTGKDLLRQQRFTPTGNQSFGV